jgi:hypothetical protein
MAVDQGVHASTLASAARGVEMRDAQKETALPMRTAPFQHRRVIGRSLDDAIVRNQSKPLAKITSALL